MAGRYECSVATLLAEHELVENGKLKRPISNQQSHADPANLKTDAEPDLISGLDRPVDETSVPTADILSRSQQ
jgi:hypothetical protein